MKRMITSSETALERYLLNSVTDTPVVNNLCSMLVQEMYDALS